jgi:hypothetical protein
MFNSHNRIPVLIGDRTMFVNAKAAERISAKRDENEVAGRSFFDGDHAHSRTPSCTGSLNSWQGGVNIPQSRVAMYR